MYSNSKMRFAQFQSPSETGKKIKNFVYQYSDLIGKGNFAKVYKGSNLNNQQVVAIKLISLDQLKSKHLEALVFEEIKILQLMNHPNILKFHQALLSQRNCYIVTQLCNQGSLQDCIKSRVPITQQQLGNIIFDLYNGLKYLREKGVIHRDIKPANIFINNGQMKIADFGLAKFYKQRFHDLDIGSPQYMSPEGLIFNTYSQKTDIWSLGITIYELIHGRTPFLQSQSQQELIFHTTRPIPEHKWRKDINPFLRQLINKLLEIDELKRPNIYQLSNEPFLKIILERKNLKLQEVKLTQSMSLSTILRPSQQQQWLRSSQNVRPIVFQRPLSFTNVYTDTLPKLQYERVQSTSSSQNSSHSLGSIQLENSVNLSNKQSLKNIRTNDHPRFSFAKMNESKRYNPCQNNPHLFQMNVLSNRQFEHQGNYQLRKLG